MICIKRTQVVFLCILLLSVTACFLSCKKDTTRSEGESYNPAEEVVISDFFPKTGGGGQRV